MARQPESSYWFPSELLSWDAKTDEDLRFNVSTVPLSERAAREHLQTVNATQNKETNIMAISIMNSSTSGNSPHGLNKVNANTFTYWQYVDTLVYSLWMAFQCTLICLLLGYPAAYILSQKQFNTSRTMVVLFILPMWVNILIRTLATVALFDFLLGEGALVFGMVYNFLPFMIYPIYNTLQKMDHNLIEAAQDLGASPTRVFGKVILPLSMPGVMSGIVMVFMPTVSTFAIAELLTMNNIKLFGTTVQENIYNGMWNYGAALSLIMLLLIGITILFTNEEDGASNESGGVI